MQHADCITITVLQSRVPYVRGRISSIVTSAVLPSVQRMEAEVTSVTRQHNKAHAGSNALLGALVAMYDGCKI